MEPKPKEEMISITGTLLNTFNQRENEKKGER
jgi:hypothetical protein